MMCRALEDRTWNGRVCCYAGLLLRGTEAFCRREAGLEMLVDDDDDWGLKAPQQLKLFGAEMFVAASSQRSVIRLRLGICYGAVVRVFQELGMLGFKSGLLGFKTGGRLQVTAGNTSLFTGVRG